MRRIILSIAVCYAVLLAVGMGIGAYIHNSRSQVSFLVTIPRSSTVKVFADLGGDTPYQYNPKKPLFTLSSSQKLKTKVGIYDFVIQNGDDYQTNVTKVTVNNATRAVTINPDLSRSKLDSELAGEQSQILAALNARFNNLPAYYTPDKIKLFKQGQWAGVTFTPNSDQYDPVRFVLNKQNGNWTVVNDPSILVIGSQYKNVPADVIAAVNAL